MATQRKIHLKTEREVQLKAVQPEPVKVPLVRADKIARSGSGFRETNGNVAAIDFGTTSVSLAYATVGDKTVVTLKLDDVKQLHRVPNAILIEKRSCEVVAIGHQAQEEYLDMRAEKKIEYIYFERIKMLMKRGEDINRNTVVESFTGEQYYLVEVVAFILKHLKDLLIGHLNIEGVKRLRNTDFDWVITVPAIWDAKGKRMMREAAYMAGLLSDGEGITQMTSFGSTVPRPIEYCTDKLSLALEPEAAAIYSQKQVTEDIVKAGKAASFSTPQCYMVIDIGGGTVDITAHVAKGDGVEVITIPTGNAWGGTQVNEQFSKMLQDIVGDPDFKKFLEHGDQKDKVKNRAALNKILYGEFEEQKVTFGSKCDGRTISGKKECTIDLRAEFIRFYTEEKIAKGASYIPGVEYDESSLYITYEAMERECFSEVIYNILECSMNAFNQVNSHAAIDTVYLVGGFGGCKYINGKVDEALKEYFPSANVIVAVPTSPHLAIASGAALWRQQPDIVKARAVDATYGIGISIPYKKEHNSYYKYYNFEKGRYYTNGVYMVFLQKGEFARPDEVFDSGDIVPSYSDRTSMLFKIYSTDRKDVQYIRDTADKENVKCIGSLYIDTPNPDNLPIEQRVVTVLIDFSGTEIQAKARYHVTDEEVKTVCDFLS